MALKVLRPNGPVNANGFSPLNITGSSANPIGDEDDGSYVSSWRYAPMGWTAPLPALVGYQPGDPIHLHLYIDALTQDEDHEGGQALYGEVAISGDSIGSSELGKFSDGSQLNHLFVIKNTSGAYSNPDLTVPLRAADTSTAVAALEAGAWLLFSSFSGPVDVELGRLWKIREAWIAVGEPDVATKSPACRKYPREDSQGVGGGRHWPRPRSRQSSPRRVGGYY